MGGRKAMRSMWHFPDGYYDDTGNWQRTKFCFIDCGERCTCMPPAGQHYSEAHDKSLIKPKESSVSYSFQVKGATKADAIELAGVQFDAVEAGQPVHAADMPAAKAATAAFANLLVDDATCDTVLSISGSVWSTTEGLRSAQINVSAAFDPPRK